MNVKRPAFDPLNPPHYCADGETAAEILNEVQIELDLIAEGQEAAENYTPRQVAQLRKWAELARSHP